MLTSIFVIVLKLIYDFFILGIGDKFYESIIQNICEAALVSVLYPRSSILVVIQEMQNCGGVRL